jgi:uncharacterized membrane protein YdbT with pleckstrin-like domain
MPPFKNRGEYEKWKAERLKEPAQQPSPALVAKDIKESYIRQNLRPGETIVREAQITPLHVSFAIAFLCLFAGLPILIGSIFSVPLGVLMGLLFFVPSSLYYYFSYKKTELGVTDLRVIEKTGVLSVNAVETALDRIQNVVYRQSMFGKIFGYGTVVIQSAARFGVEGIPNVREPQKLRDAILQQVELYRQKQIQDQAEAIAKSMLRKQQ